MNLAKAEKIAYPLLEELHNAEVLRMGAVAGSIRRKKPEVKDIEIVAEPILGLDMFGHPDIHAPSELDKWIDSSIQIGEIARGDKNGKRYKQLIHVSSGMKIDLFLVLPPAQWGAIMAIRTGPAAFSQWLVTPKQKGGALPSIYKQRDGALWYKGELVETATEEAYFEKLGIPWIPPEKR